ncbi:OsmC family protein [Sphingopyxis sp. JAI108]|uniref:OsmC family protein n=1 Tax=Sphingopyxis sp. JAI108 TaxID=2723060 RepID=UPI0015C8C792|nr:OsmC family protein [Sphingopyxis sp. JAI108]NYF30611.1 putative redox protein [Sphingopyxis sp. JAI108]
MAALRTRVTVSETGQSPFAVRIEMGAQEILGDEPAAAGGGGLGPNPFDLLVAALAECTAMTVRWYARRHDLPLEHVEVVVDHTRRLVAGAAEPVDVFDKVVFLRGPALDEEQRARLIDAAAHCPIQRLLEGSPLINTRPGRPLGELFDR